MCFHDFRIAFDMTKRSRTLRCRAQCKGHKRASIAKNTPYLAVNAALTLLHGASRTARCGATRRRIRTEDGHQPPCAHTARLSKTLLLAVGAEARASAAIFSIDIHPHHSRKNEGACSQFVISFTAVQKWCVRPVCTDTHTHNNNNIRTTFIEN